MARMQLKERQFEPTGNNLGTFEAKDLESFDVQFKDYVKDEDEATPSKDNPNAPKSHVPDPIDPEPLDKNSKSGVGNDGDGKSANPNQEPQNNNPDDEGDQGLSDIPDKWDPYGKDMDNYDPDMPDMPQDTGDDLGYGGGSEDDSTGPQSPSNSNQSGEGNDSDNNGSSDGQGNDTDSESEDSSSQDGSSDGQGGGQQSGSDGNEPNSTDGSSANSEGGQGSEDGGSNSSSSNQQSDKDTMQGNNPNPGKSQSSVDTRDSGGGNGEDASYDPNAKAPESDDDDDFNPAGNIQSISDLEKALETLNNNESNTSKERRESEERQEKQNERNNRNRGQQEIRDKQEEAAAAKEILSKAIQDKKEAEKNNSDDDNSSRRNSEVYESEDDILGDLGAGNLTTLFNPSNARDWRVQLDRLFDSALGLDVVTNPNLVNKKIEDAPPGREDYDPVIKNVVILLDYSGSMGAVKFKEVISHIDTMLKARKMTKTTFHLFPWGISDVGVLLDMYTKCKGAAFKRTINAKFKEGKWGTYLAPVIPIVMKKVHKPDAIIILTDAQIFDVGKFNDNSMCTRFIKKFKNRIIWALTMDADMGKMVEIDPTAKAKKRYIKFKKGR